MVFETHLGRIFDLGGTAAEQLVGCCRRHCAGHSHFTLASHFCAGYRGVGLGNVADQSGRCESAVYARVGEVAAFLQVIEHSRHHSARSAGGGGHDLAARSVLLAHGKGVAEHQSAALQVGFVAGGSDVVGICAAAQVERAGQYSLLIKAALYRGGHRLPYFCEIFPYFRTLALFDIFPIGLAGVLAPVEYLR